MRINLVLMSRKNGGGEREAEEAENGEHVNGFYDACVTKGFSTMPER